MINGRRVVSYTPFGRMRTFCMTVPYLIRAHLAGEIDEHMLCLNFDREANPTRISNPDGSTTTVAHEWAKVRDPLTGEWREAQAEDHAYAYRLAEWYPEIFKLYECPGPNTPELADRLPAEWKDGYRQPKQMNTGRFVWYMQDPEAVYVRLDDDIVWLHNRFFPELVTAKLDHPELLAVFPIIWNNAICSHVLQRNHHLDDRFGIVQPYATDQVGWAFPQFAEYVHETLLHHIDHDHEDACLGVNEGARDPVGPWFLLGQRQQFSVSAFAIEGSEYAALGGVLNWDEEEHWLTMHQPGILNRTNGVYAGAQCSHLTFFTQSDHIWNRTEIPHRYWKHSEALYRSLPEEWQRGR